MIPSFIARRVPFLQTVRLRQLRRRTKKSADEMMDRLKRTLVVPTPAGPLSFVTLGSVAAARGLSLLTKQPGTIEWIDRFDSDAVFWDVGANVGVYSLYAARRGVARVVAIEPAAVNYFLLAANSEANRLDDRIDCLLLGLGAGRSVASLDVSQFAAASSFSFKAQARYTARQTALVLSMDELVEQFGVPCPNYIKIDAPGMIESIIAGGARTLARPEVREIHVELRDSKAGRRVTAVLEESGLRPRDRFTHGSTADVTFVRFRPN
jgi:FkbM family methyltransferase